MLSLWAVPAPFSRFTIDRSAYHRVELFDPHGPICVSSGMDVSRTRPFCIRSGTEWEVGNYVSMERRPISVFHFLSSCLARQLWCSHRLCSIWCFTPNSERVPLFTFVTRFQQQALALFVDTRALYSRNACNRKSYTWNPLLSIAKVVCRTYASRLQEVTVRCSTYTLLSSCASSGELSLAFFYRS